MTADRPWKVTGEGLWLAVRLTPRSSRDGFDGIRIEADGRIVLRVRIAAPPVAGAANAALIAFLAKCLGLRKADVRIESGDTARTKRLLVAGDGAAIAARIEAVIAAAR